MTSIEDLLRDTLAHPPVAADPPADPVGALDRRIRALRRRRRTVLASAVGTVAVLAAAGVVVGTSIRMPSDQPAGGAVAAMSVPTAAGVGTASAGTASGLLADVPPPSVVETRALELVRAHPGGRVDGPAEWVQTSYQQARVVMGFGDGTAAGEVYILQLRGTFSCLCPGPQSGGPAVVHVITEYVTAADHPQSPGKTQAAGVGDGAGSLGQAPYDLSRLGQVHRFTVTP